MLRVLTHHVQGWSPLHVAASEKQHVWRWMVNNQEKMQSLQDAKHEILTISKPEVTFADLHQYHDMVCEGVALWH